MHIFVFFSQTASRVLIVDSPPPARFLYQRHLSSPSLEHALLVGGTDFRKASKLAKSPCDVIVGTPGRVLDFLEKGLINPRFVRLLVSVYFYRGEVWAEGQ